ncbi:MAG: hypothetical protein V3U09_03790, partial [Thermoplasmata archaeon]
MSTTAVTIKSRILSKKTTYCFLAVLVLVNLIYRYPIGITHEVGADTTFIHSLANSLSQEGYAKWVLNPLSFFGLYALSYPSAAPFLISMISEMAGMSIEFTILILGTFFGVIGSVSSFLVAREIIKDERYAFIVALLFSLAPLFLKDTTWVGSSRGFVVAFLPVIV